MPVHKCDGIFQALVNNAYLKLDHRKGSRRDRQWAIAQFFPVADTIADAFCIGGSRGLEYANYFKSHPVPETDKKLEVAARSELTCNCSYNRFLKLSEVKF
jgi:trehalose utilization protein